jgi:thymidylate synthase
MRPGYEDQYLDLAERILEEGEVRGDRTGVGTRELFGEQMKFDLREGFPVLTTKKVALGAVASELAWMLHGDTNLRYLAEHNNHIWDEWPFVAYLEELKIPQPPQGSDEWNQLKKAYLDQIIADEKNRRRNDIFSEIWRPRTGLRTSVASVGGLRWRADRSAA